MKRAREGKGGRREEVRIKYLEAAVTAAPCEQIVPLHLLVTTGETLWVPPRSD